MNNDIIGTETESLISTRKIEIWNWEKLRDLRIENKKPWFCKLSYGFLFVSLSIKKVQFHPEKKPWKIFSSDRWLLFCPTDFICRPKNSFLVPNLWKLSNSLSIFHSSQKFHQMRSKNSIFNRNNKTYYSVN